MKGGRRIGGGVGRDIRGRGGGMEENIEGENEEIIEDKKIEPTDEEVKAVDSDEIENTETEILLKKRKGSRSSKSTRKTRKLRDMEGRVDHKIF